MSGVVSVGFGAAALATVVGIIIVAVVIAVMQGMIVINAAELPGQLAELIVDARTDAPDVDELIDTTDGMTTLMALFVVATLPEPRDEYCDNSSTIPDNIEHGGFFVDLSWRPCLNRHRDPGGDAVRPAVPDQGGRRDHGNAVTDDHVPGPRGRRRPRRGCTTAGSSSNRPARTTSRRSRSSYIDWDGKQQQAWLLGNPDARPGVRQPRRHKRPDRGLEDCLDDGLCSESKSLEYLSPDGKKLSASVEPWKPAVGAPSYDATPVELSPTSYDANGFAPTDATGEVSYEWRFEKAPCTKPCVLLEGPLAPPTTATRCRAPTVTHTWPYPGPFTVALTATDAEGRTATTSVRGSGAERAATDPGARSRLPAERGRQPGAWSGCLSRHGIHGDPAEAPGFIRRRAVRLAGEHQLGGRQRRGATAFPPPRPNRSPPSPAVPRRRATDLELKPTEVGGDRFFEFDASHVYAEPGVYHGTMWVSDGVGASAEPFTMTIEDPTDVLVTTNTADGVVRIAETGRHEPHDRGASGLPAQHRHHRRLHGRQPPGSGGRWGPRQRGQLHLAHVHPRQLGPTPAGHGARRRRQLPREQPAPGGRRHRRRQGRGAHQHRRPRRFVRHGPCRWRSPTTIRPGWCCHRRRWR